MVIHSVSRRIREFGVRMSVGATPRDLLRDVLTSGLWMLVPGLIAGLVFAATGARLAQVVFVGVNVLNPITYLAVALLQAAIVLLACIGPALASLAGRSDPGAALGVVARCRVQATVSCLGTRAMSVPSAVY